MNRVTLIGNLATDVELRQLDGGKQVATFVLAVDGPGDDADFFRVAAWERQAEVCARYLVKGKRVGVDGRLKSSSWTDGDGKRRTSVEVVARQVEFLSPPEGGPAEVPCESAAA